MLFLFGFAAAFGLFGLGGDFASPAPGIGTPPRAPLVATHAAAVSPGHHRSVQDGMSGGPPSSGGGGTGNGGG